MSDIAGSTVFVTGGGSGIGLAIASRFARDGAHVTICGRTESKLTKAVGEISASARGGAEIRHVVADVTIEDEIARAVEVAASVGASGYLDVLVANAGGSFHIGSVLDADRDKVDATVQLNLMGTFLSIKHGGASMVHGGGGSIVAVSSGAGHFPHRFLWAYGMAKAAVEMLVACAAEELGASGVRVNAVQPGIVDDDLMAPITSGGPLLDDYRAQMPIARPGKPEEVAEAVRFLAGPEASWITGECLAIDGGHHLRRGADYSLLLR